MAPGNKVAPASVELLADSLIEPPIKASTVPTTGTPSQPPGLASHDINAERLAKNNLSYGGQRLGKFLEISSLDGSRNEDGGIPPTFDNGSSSNNLFDDHSVGWRAFGGNHVKDDHDHLTSFDSVEEDNNVKKSVLLDIEISPWASCMLLPTSTSRIAWDMFVLVLLFFIFITVPLGLAFGERFERHMVTVDFTIDCIFIFDVCLNFRTGYKPSDDEDIVVMNPKKVGQQQLQKLWMGGGSLDSICRRGSGMHAAFSL